MPSKPNAPKRPSQSKVVRDEKGRYAPRKSQPNYVTERKKRVPRTADSQASPPASSPASATSQAYDNYQKAQRTTTAIPARFQVSGEFDQAGLTQVGEALSIHCANADSAIPATWRKRSNSISTSVRSTAGLGNLILTSDGFFSWKAPTTPITVKGEVAQLDQIAEHKPVPQDVHTKLANLSQTGWYRYWVGANKARKSYRQAVQAVKDGDSRTAGWHLVQVSKAMSV